ncbi:MAG: flagellar hook-length control protein FliK [Phaeospirillum sp.]|nr:flagellar hook-length control protein FliK [Phaeospirillum sp.]
MTVQSIDKRLTPETNMTPAAQDKQQGGVSVEDAFVALLQQTTQRFGGKSANMPAPGKLLSETVVRTHMELKADRAQTARDDNQPDRAAVRDTRVTAKSDKLRQPRKADTPAADTADSAAPTAAADNAKPASSARTDDQSATRDDDQPQPQQTEPVAAAPVAQEQVVIEIDIEETVQVFQIGNGAPAAQIDADPSAKLAKEVDVGDALAGLGPDDRQRITDLQNKIVGDLESGDADDALDSVTELVSQLIDKTNLHKMGNAHQQGIGQNDVVQAQAQDLANRLAGSGAALDIKVQTNQIDPGVQNAATAVDAMTLMDLAAMSQQGANAESGQTAQQNTQSGTAPAAVQAVQATTAAPVIEEVRTFSAVLAAQAEATAPKVEEPKQQSATPLAGIGATQATDKPASAQTAAAVRAPRVPLQQQVMDQVRVQIDKAVKDGVDTVKIQLKPLDLGKIEIKLEMIEGRVSATVTAERPETLALLQKDAKGLEKALEDAGLKPEANSTSFNLRGGEQQQNADRGNNNQRPGRGRNRGQGHDPETTDIGSAQAAQSNRSGIRSGVDISV